MRRGAFPQKAVALETKDASPNAVQVIGTIGASMPFHDAFHAAAEREAVDRCGVTLAFSKDAYDLASA